MIARPAKIEIYCIFALFYTTYMEPVPWKNDPPFESIGYRQGFGLPFVWTGYLQRSRFPYRAIKW